MEQTTHADLNESTQEAPAAATPQQRVTGFRMLSLSARMQADRHQYLHGFKNVAYLVGYIRHINANGFFLQMTNSENLMIPVTFQAGRKLPRGFSEFDPVKVYARIVVKRDNWADPEIMLVIVRLDRPNVLELPGAAAFYGKVHEQSTETTRFKPYGSGNAASKACNQVIIAGFVSGYDLRLMNPEYGEGSNERLIIKLQQSENPDEAIPVRQYGHNLGSIASRLRNGMAVFFWGSIRTGLSPTGKKDPQTGKDIMVSRIEVRVTPPELAFENEIVFLGQPEMTPKWVKDLAEKATSRPARSVTGEDAAVRAATPVAAATQPATPSISPVQPAPTHAAVAAIPGNVDW
ncbi:MAG: hypothetical protein PHP05_06200 [Sideroxydans sp.]|nr:hypothetical protein [Sideroxydans sp.]